MTARTTFIAVILVALVSGVLSATGLAEAIGYQGDAESAEDAADAGESGIAAASDASTATDSSAENIRQDVMRGPIVQHKTAFFLPEGPSILGDLEIGAFLMGLEADRRLLSELRKLVPDDRKEAEIFLRRLKELAERADPVRLAPRANRVLEQAPIYYDWLETEYETAEEEIYEYYIGGAQGFSRALQEFENAVLLTAMNRLETAGRALQEVYSEPLE